VPARNLDGSRFEPEPNALERALSQRTDERLEPALLESVEVVDLDDRDLPGATAAALDDVGRRGLVQRALEQPGEPAQVRA
jgi:hypothetical protein